METTKRTTKIRIKRDSFRSDLRAFSSWSKAPKVRTIAEFAEQEIIIAGNGRYRGFKFSLSRQPHVRLWFEAIASGLFRRYVMTGPSQSGKSLIGFVIIAMYYLFERGETVILGLPTMEMASDKWKKDIEPAIRLSRYRKLLPTRGTGSRGGKFESVTFKNGATLKFMSGGGDDKKRSSYDARILIVTETDGLDTPGDTSREADPLQQLEARTASFGEDARIFLECTVSEETGRTWKEIKEGSDSRIALRCPHCGKWVTPGRESLVGWQGAPDEVTAAERSAFYCDLCGAMWTEEQRRLAHIDAKLVHKGQEITETGEITGNPPRTFTLGYRYSAVNNLLVPAGVVGAKEWRAAKSDNPENDERALCQFTWAIPPKPSVEALVSLDARAIASKIAHPARGYVPEGGELLTVGIDVHKWHIEWVIVSWLLGCRGHIVDYGVESVPSDAMLEEMAILTTLRTLWASWQSGWQCSNLGPRFLRFGLVDSGYQSDIVYRFCRETGDVLMPSKGQGATQRAGAYTQPRGVSPNVKHIGEQWHVGAVPMASGGSIGLVEINVDHWKTWLHERWRCALGAPGSMELFHSAKQDEHFTFAKHQTSEEKQLEFTPGKGETVKWVKKNSQNHWLDALSYACVAANIAGVKLIVEKSDETKPAGKRAEPVRSLFNFGGDGDPFLVIDR